MTSENQYDQHSPISTPTRLRDVGRTLNPIVKRALFGTVTTLTIIGVTLAACGGPTSTKGQQARADKEASVILCGQQNESQECVNLKRKFDRDNDANRITYVYLLSWTGEFIGYYVVKGKVSSNQSQMAPMDSSVRICTYADSGCYALGEAPGDDGSYGPNEDGIFFFTVDGTKITWNGLYQQSDKPLTIKAPQLYGN